MQFARVATRHGLVSRRQLASWGVEHLRYRLRGTTDERTTEVLRVARELIAGVPARSRRTDEPRGDGGDPAARLPADARRGPRPPGRRPRRPSSSAPPATAWSSRWPGAGDGRRHRHPLRGRRGRRPSPAASTAPSSTAQGKVEAMRGLRRRARHRPRRLLRLLRLDLRPADAARGRQPGRRQPRPAPGRDRPRGGLADDALRAARPPPGRDRGHPAGDGRRLRRLPHRRPPQAAAAPLPARR